MGSDESHFNVSLIVRDKVTTTVPTDHNFRRERRTAEADSNRGPAYQPNALPLGQTGSRMSISKHFSLRPERRGGLLRTGTGGDEGEREKAPHPLAPTRKTEEAVDRRQSNKNVKAVSPRHCVAASVLRNYCFNCCTEH